MMEEPGFSVIWRSTPVQEAMGELIPLDPWAPPDPLDQLDLMVLKVPLDRMDLMVLKVPRDLQVYYYQVIATVNFQEYNKLGTF